MLGFPSFFSSNKISFEDVDIHSHLIPFIDDGAKNMERSIKLVLSLKKMGYKKIITTPHVSDMFPNSSKKILEGYNLLKEELRLRSIKIELEVAAEYYLDENFERLLAKKDILTFGENNYLLFELSYFTRPSDLDSLIQDIKLAGYIPVLAHPERYEYFHHSIDEYIHLKSLGVLFQINLISMVNYYSVEIGTMVQKIIQHGLVDFVGSDTHHRNHIEALSEVFSSSLYKKLFKKNIILNNSLI
jgi:tyrosine-protein phosphatase YwqE